MNPRRWARYGLILFLATAPRWSLAQIVRTWVSTAGVDSNPCSKTAPCRTFNAAISAVSAKGEVVAMDSGGYGPATITKSVSLIVPSSIHAAIAPTSGDAITVNTGEADAVVLRGLTLNGLGGANGIQGLGDGELYVEEMVINGFVHNGIRIDFLSALHLFVADTQSRNNGASGIALAGPNRVMIDNVRLEQNGTEGLLAYDAPWVAVRNTVAAGNATGFRLYGLDTARMQIDDSVASNNSGPGFLVESAGDPAWGTVELNLERCRASGNGKGILAGLFGSTRTALVRVSNSAITNNGVGVESITSFTDGRIYSRGNNTLEGNTTGNTFTLTYPAK